MAKEILYGYKMTHDTGFAPNPYHGVLTLATCKPLIRKCAKEGYWISGWTSNEVQGKEQAYHFTDETQKLIYLAKVSKVISFKEYWEKYPLKRPAELDSFKEEKECRKSCGNTVITNSSEISLCGDNIYKPINDSDFEQIENIHHGPNCKEHDLSGEHVLVCDEFYYFGVESAISVKKNDVVHRWKKFSTEDEQKIIEFVTKNYSKGRNPKKK